MLLLFAIIGIPAVMLLVVRGIDDPARRRRVYTIATPVLVAAATVAWLLLIAYNAN